MKTLQETFDKIVDHLRKQNSKSLMEAPRDDTCAYRGKDGKMCAVGCLIEDEFYDPSLEGNIVYDEKVKNALRNSGYYIDDKFIQLMDSMQKCHDGKDVKDWESSFISIANEYNLELKPL